MDDLWREPIERVIQSAVEYLDEHPDAVVSDAVLFGMAIESALYGVPSRETPIGFVNSPSPLKDSRKS